MKYYLSILIILFSITLNGQSLTVTKVGDQVPAFSFMDLEGNELHIEDFKGKTVLINLFTTWCGPCRKELPHLEESLQQQYSEEELVILVFGRNHDAATLKKFESQTDFSFTFYPDPERAIYDLFAREVIPRNILIDAEGKIVYQSVGYTPELFEELKDHVSLLLKK